MFHRFILVPVVQKTSHFILSTGTILMTLRLPAFNAGSFAVGLLVLFR